jgi:hypothetical protein
MIKRNELADPASCLNLAFRGEMLFVLRAKDAAAPFAIRAWVEQRILLGKNVVSDPQIVEALAIAETMERQRRRGIPE